MDNGFATDVVPNKSGQDLSVRPSVRRSCIHLPCTVAPLNVVHPCICMVSHSKRTSLSPLSTSPSFPCVSHFPSIHSSIHASKYLYSGSIHNMTSAFKNSYIPREFL